MFNQHTRRNIFSILIFILISSVYLFTSWSSSYYSCNKRLLSNAYISSDNLSNPFYEPAHSELCRIRKYSYQESAACLHQIRLSKSLLPDDKVLIFAEGDSRVLATMSGMLRHIFRVMEIEESHDRMWELMCWLIQINSITNSYERQYQIHIFLKFHII